MLLLHIILRRTGHGIHSIVAMSLWHRLSIAIGVGWATILVLLLLTWPVTGMGESMHHKTHVVWAGQAATKGLLLLCHVVLGRERMLLLMVAVVVVLLLNLGEFFSGARRKRSITH